MLRRSLFFFFYLLLLVNLAVLLLYEGSNYFTGRGINQSVFYQIAYGFAGVNLLAFLPFILGVVIAGILIVAFFVVLHRTQYVRRLRMAGLVTISGLLLAIFLFNPATAEIFHVLKTNFRQQEKAVHTFDDGAAIDYHKVFATPVARRAGPLKNIVYIYAESLERTFMDQTLFPGLMQDIAELEEHGASFTNVQSTTGTTWTMGGTVASQCGVPLVLPLGEGNSMGHLSHFMPNATCLGDSLRFQGYDLEFIGGAPLSFAGKGKFYRDHGFSTVLGLDELKQQDQQQNEWGLYDSDTFSTALEHYRERLEGQKPFGLFVMTLDTHPPHGYAGPECDDPHYGDGSNAMLNAVSCSQRQISNFIKAIFQTPGSENTVVVLASDHLMLKSDVFDILQQRDRRDLFVMWDGGLSGPGRTIEKAGSTLDAAATIQPKLGLESGGRYGLGVDLDSPENETLIERAGNIDRANAAIDSWYSIFKKNWYTDGSLSDGISISSDGNSGQVLGQTVAFPALFNVNEDGTLHGIEFKDLFVHFAKGLASGGSPILVATCHDLGLLTHQMTKEGGFCALWHGSDSLLERQLRPNVEIEFAEGPGGAVKEVPTNEHLSADLAALSRSETLSHFAHDRRLGRSDKGIFRAVSRGKPTGFSSLTAPDGTMLKVDRRGLNLYSIDGSGGTTFVGAVDTCGKRRDGAKGLADLAETAPDGSHFLVISNDSSRCGNPIAWAFEDTPLSKYKSIGFRTPYIAVWSGDTAEEFTGRSQFQLELRVSFPDHPSPAG